MAALVGIAANLRAIAAAHVAFQFMDRRCLRAPHDVRGDGLVRVAAKTTDFEVAVPGIEGIASAGDGRAGPLKASMRLVHAAQASLSASRRAIIARSAAARTSAQKMLSRDFVPMNWRMRPATVDEQALRIAVDNVPPTGCGRSNGTIGHRAGRQRHRRE
jgi:hypothetical protein